MNKRILDADAFNELLEWINANKEDICDFVEVDGVYIHAFSLIQKIRGLATPTHERTETSKTNLTKFTTQLFDAIGQNVEAGKLDIKDDDFDKMETIAFRLIDAMNIATPATEPQESIFDAEGWGDMREVPINTEVEVMVNCKRIIRAKFDKNLSICTDDIDHNKIRVLNKWRPLPTLPTGGNHVSTR